MRPFAFRQRVGDVNWRAVSSVDLEKIVDDNEIEELQSIVDEVTFCDVKSCDIKGNTIQSVKKLIHLMQLMLEYLLYCQETQLQLIYELQKKNNNIKSHNKLLLQKNESSKEDIRIYRRQLAMMKESMKNLNVQDNTVELPPRVFDPLRDSRGVKGNRNENIVDGGDKFNPIIDSMLQHERETRNFVKEIITEQRQSFLSEFEKISNNVHNSGSRNSLVTEEIERKLQSNMESILSELRKSHFTKRDTNDNKENVDILENERKRIREYERQVERREDKLGIREEKVLVSEEKLSQQEKDIQDRMHDLDMRIQEFQKNNDRGNVPKPIISQRSVGVNTPPFEELVPKPRNNANNAIAFNMIMRILKRGCKEQCQYYFIHWKNIAISDRMATHEGQLKQMKLENSEYASELIMLREQNQVLQSQVASEKEKYLIESARANTLNRKLQEIDVAKIMAKQTSLGSSSKKRKEEVIETEEEMMSIALKRIESEIVNPDMTDIVERLASEIINQSAGDDSPNEEEEDETAD